MIWQTHTGQVYQNRQNSETAFGRSFTEGDVIGCGIMLNSWNELRVFFTLNGEMLGAPPSFTGVPTGMPLVPCCGSIGECKIKANFVGQRKKFRWTPDETLLKRNGLNYIEQLPTELLEAILTKAIISHSVVCLTLSRVSKLWNDLANTEAVWRALFLKRWRNQNPTLQAKSWHKLYKARHMAVSKPTFGESLIENCSFDFLCPMTWEQLEQQHNSSSSSNNGDRERYCNVCKQNVYKVDTPGQLQQAIQLGRCASVVIVKQSTLIDLSLLTLTGRIVSPRDWDENEDDLDEWDDWSNTNSAPSWPQSAAKFISLNVGFTYFGEPANRWLAAQTTSVFDPASKSFFSALETWREEFVPKITPFTIVAAAGRLWSCLNENCDARRQMAANADEKPRYDPNTM